MPQNPDRVEPTLVPGGSSYAESVSKEIASNIASNHELPRAQPDAQPVSASSEFPYESSVAEPQYGLGQAASAGEDIPPPAGYNGGIYGDGGGDGGGGGGGDEPEPPEMHRMSFFDHLEELRRRIFYSLIAVAVGMGVCWTFADNIYAGLARPLTNVLRELKLPDKLAYTNPTGPFNLYIKLAMIAGIFLSSPFLIYQVWKFISPGLYKNEKKYAVPFILFCSGLFISGGAFAYFVAFPAALHFLLSFASQFTPIITVDEYFSLASTIILGLAIVFELPVLILFLTLLHIVTPGYLLRNFRYAFLIIVIIAAAITPTSDIVNMMIFAAPLMVLYFLGVGLSYLVVKARTPKGV